MEDKSDIEEPIYVVVLINHAIDIYPDIPLSIKDFVEIVRNDGTISLRIRYFIDAAKEVIDEFSIDG